MSGKREMQDLAKQCRARGWKITKTKSGHGRWLAPDGKSVLIVPGTPSDSRSFLNCRAFVRRIERQIRKKNAIS